MNAHERRGRIVALLAMLALTPPALANAGTPLMWLTMGHLLIGNALIGVGEAVLIARLFKARLCLAVPVLIVANYVSMIAGAALVGHYGGDIGGIARLIVGEESLSNAIRFNLLALLSLAFVTTLVEWPFVFAVLPARNRVARSIVATLAAQAASYLVLTLLYFRVSNMSVVTQTVNTDPADFARTTNAWVYYLPLDRSGLWRVRPDGADNARVREIGAPDEWARLYWLRSTDGAGWDLWITTPADRPTYVPSGPQRPKQPLLTGLAGRAAMHRRDETPGGTRTNNWTSWGKAPDLRLAGADELSVRAGFWPAEGLVVGKGDLYTGRCFAMETPVTNWVTRSPTLLPHDQVVYQLGDQIVLLDLNTRQIGLITRGTSPVVIIEEAPPTSAPSAP